MERPFTIHEPIHNNPPTEQEKKDSEELHQFLVEEKVIEDQAGITLRVRVLSDLQNILNDWVRGVFADLNQLSLNDSDTMNQHVLLHTFGSFRLGANAPDDDIDSLCICPQYIDRDAHFFDILFPILQSTPGVQTAIAVRTAYVPIIKLCFNTISIDLLCATIQYQTLPAELNLASSDFDISIYDDKTRRSLNGCRVTDTILMYPENKTTFQEALRLIKLWARRRGVYANVYGYLGGVSWAILVAMITIKLPTVASSVLVSEFFQLYSSPQIWKTQISLNGTQLPKNQNKEEPMIVPTPCYPPMNSTHNVSKSTMAVLQKEFSRGWDIIQNVLKGDDEWSTLVEPSPFFTEYSTYLQLTYYAPSEEILKQWIGFGESRLHYLVNRMEEMEEFELVHPFPMMFKHDEYDEEFGEEIKVKREAKLTAEDILNKDTSGDFDDDSDEEEENEKSEMKKDEAGDDSADRHKPTEEPTRESNKFCGSAFIGLKFATIQVPEGFAARIDLTTTINDWLADFAFTEYTDEMLFAPTILKRNEIPPFVFEQLSQYYPPQPHPPREKRAKKRVLTTDFLPQLPQIALLNPKQGQDENEGEKRIRPQSAFGEQADVFDRTMIPSLFRRPTILSKSLIVSAKKHNEMKLFKPLKPLLEEKFIDTLITFENTKQEQDAIINAKMAELDELKQSIEKQKNELERERKRLELIQNDNETQQLDDQAIELNVGGVIFCTQLKTLRRFESSMLFRMFSGSHLLPRDKQGRIFIDRNPRMFELLLEYMRTGHLPLSFRNSSDEKSFQTELDYFALSPQTVHFNSAWNSQLKSNGLKVSEDGKTVEVVGDDGDHTVIIGDNKITHGTITVSVKVSIPRPNRYSFGVLPDIPTHFNRGFGYKNGLLGWGLHDHQSNLGIYCQTQLVAPSTLGYSTNDVVTLTVDVDRGNLTFKVNGIRCAELLSCEMIKLGVYIGATLFNHGATWSIVP
ncbi:putative polyA polymerase [Blattamonas nauphoetae]|uniref:polynucleotide adenylyltransferase n=1 Tax=Blattamonas nauphoetae TaxID=2049346 RepID=A0ABQ9YET0_9EUKA|nr:putative polyA polymerase [Blattamonas nauphoetae]